MDTRHYIINKCPSAKSAIITLTVKPPPTTSVWGYSGTNYMFALQQLSTHPIHSCPQ